MAFLFCLFQNIFQSTPPRRRRRYRFVLIQQQKYFQSTPPRRRRPKPTGLLVWFYRTFQSTPPRRRRLRRKLYSLICGTFFNPRLREGGDEALKNNISAQKFSIHASAKEATKYSRPSVLLLIFNPRLREGGDK